MAETSSSEEHGVMEEEMQAGYGSQPRPPPAADGVIGTGIPGDMPGWGREGHATDMDGQWGKHGWSWRVRQMNKRLWNIKQRVTLSSKIDNKLLDL